MNKNCPKSKLPGSRVVTRAFKQKVQSGDSQDIVDENTRKQIQVLTNNEELEKNQKPFKKCDQSQASEKTSSSKKKLLYQELTSEAWIQCDNISCQKWRKVPQDQLDRFDLDQKWFCSLNVDKSHNTCNASEEDYKEYDRIADNIGVKYVFSELPEGTLVWAKMHGYCRWPALVTKDPDFPYHIVYDTELGFPAEYHVEFLGSKHSHRWIHTKFIETYGHKQDIIHSEHGIVRTKKSQKQKIFRKRKTLNLHQPKTKYGKISVSDAVAEANKLLMVSENERLKSCRFKPKCNKKSSGDNAVKALQCSKKGATESEFPFDKYGSIHKKRKVSDRPIYKLTDGDKTEKPAKGYLKKCNKNKSKPDELLPQKVPVYMFDQTVKEKDMKGTKKLKEAENTDAIVPSNKLLSSLNCSLVDKTKEEKFKLDIEMYSRNERAFEHDVTRFMKRSEIPLQKTPIWRNTPVRLFQMFLAVHERGGYHQVTNKRLWAAVFRELTDTQEFNGAQIKKYYEKNLLPYELYINGHDYKNIVKKLKCRETGHKTKTEKKIKKVVSSISQNEDTKSLQSETSTDLEEMLADLENVGNMCQFYDDYCQETGINKLDLTFIDETPPKKLSPNIKEANTASEFGEAHFPAECARLVPHVVRMTNDEDDQDDHENIFHEMQALEEEIDALEDDMLNIY